MIIKNTRQTISLFVSSLLLSTSLSAHAEFEVSGYVGGEARYYPSEGLYPEQEQKQLSANVEPEFAWTNEAGNHTIVFKPYYRYDAQDSERTHGDIRELSWLTFGDTWEVKAGINKVFWGVTESVHLVDVINQTDFVESADGEDKLGQPMVQFTYTSDEWGILETYLLPYFRERTFSGVDGRYRTAIELNTDDAVYESKDEEKHIDYAIRWSSSYEYFDVGLSWFQGTNRNPIFIVDTIATGPTGQPVINPETGPIPTSLVPYYSQVGQAGLDLQATVDAWLLKLEAAHVMLDKEIKVGAGETASTIELDSYTAAVTGFEYTFTGPFDTAWDLGVLAEYQYNSEGKDSNSPAQNDVFTGARFAFNDMASTELLVGASKDLDFDNTYSGLIELSTRLGDSVRFTVDAFLFESGDEQNFAHGFRRDGYVQANVEYYY